MSEKKKLVVEEVSKLVDKYKVVGIVDMHNLPSKQLMEIKENLRGKAKIKMVKKRLIKIIFEKSGKKGMEKLLEHMGRQPALIFTNENPFSLARVLENSASQAHAKAGDVAPSDIVVKEGPTNLSPGPVIGELQKAKIPVKVEGNKLHVIKDVVVVKKGEKISEEVANALAKLDIKPMKIMLDLLCAYDGVVYGKDILFKPLEDYLNDISAAINNALNLALNINYPTKLTLPVFIREAYTNALNLALNLNFVCEETVELILKKAYMNAVKINEIVKKGGV